MNQRFRIYLLSFFSVIGLLSLVLGLNVVFLWRSFEVADLATVIQRQQAFDSLYGPTVSEQNWLYKLELVKALKPDIVALGSSKFMVFQSEAFKTSFVNAGGAMFEPLEGAQFLNALFPFHKPKIIILGVDYFWFTADHPLNSAFPQHAIQPERITVDKVLKPLTWLMKRKISLREYLRIVLLGHRQNTLEDFDNMGLFAIEQGTGYRKDGSRFYGARSIGQEPEFNDWQFHSALASFDSHTYHFQRGAHVDAARFAFFMEMVRLCRANGVQPILILSPPSVMLYKKIEKAKDEFHYVAELDQMLRQKAKAEGYDYYNFMDLERLGSSDCECIDGTHAGATAHYRMLQWILKHHPTSSLASSLNGPVIASTIARFAGHALVVTEPAKVHVVETDYLGLGCQKR